LTIDVTLIVFAKASLEFVTEQVHKFFSSQVKKTIPRQSIEDFSKLATIAGDNILWLL